MGDVARPMLAEVLAALTGVPVEQWGRDRVVALVSATGAARYLGQEHPWLHVDPAEAQETLVARGLLPEGWCGDPRRGWLCAVCSGRGAVTYQTEGGLEDDGCGVCAVDDPGATGGVRLTGYTPHASTIPDLVAVVSLGWDAVHRAEELARDACAALREYGCPQPERVVWRVGERARADALLWRDSTHNRVQVSARGVVLVHGRLDVRPECRVVAGAEALWDSGLALDAITADAVRIVAPPVGGSRG